MRRMLSVAVAVWLHTTAQQALAQTIRGTVVDDADRALTGVVVLLLDPAAREVARVLSNERGEFRLAVPRPGSYRIRTLRIGFRSVTTEAVAVVGGDDIVRRIVLTGTAFTLDTVRAVGRNACRVVAGDSTTVIAVLWDQVRSALIATQLTLNTRTIFATTLRYERTMDARSQRIGRQSVDIRGDYARQPWRSMPADSLRRNGYVFTAPGDVRTYYAPGLEVLLSDEFIEDHCLRIAPNSSDTRLGIEFEPNADRRKFAEIRGTLWLDRATSELRDLEYRYVNVSSEEERIAGGTVGFTRMRDGMWSISRWSIRMPTMVSAPVYGDRLKVVGRELRVDSIKVTGGELVLAVLGSRGRGDTIWMRPRLTLNGVVIDSLSGRSVPRAIVALAGTVQMDTTDDRGRFTIHGVLPGRYAVNVRTPSLDSLNTVDQRTVLFSDSSMTMSIRVPNASMIAGSICGERAEGGIVLGSVTRDRDTTALPNARVWVEWTEITIASRGGGTVDNRKHVRDTRTDTRGVFRMCGLPLNTRLTFTAAVDSAEASPLPVRIAGGRFARADLTLDQRRVTTSTFGGLVVDSAGGPLTDVEVSLPELGLTTRTDGRGAFQITGLIPGTHKAVARRVGYGVLESSIEFGPGQTTDRRIVMTRLTVLDSVLTRANRDRDPLMQLFEERRRMGLGQFITREEIINREGSLLSSFLQQRPGLTLLSFQGNEMVEGSRPSPTNCTRVIGLRPPRAGLTPDAGVGLCLMREGVYYVPDAFEQRQGIPIACYARVYLDNQLMNPGSPTRPFNLREVVTTQVEAMEWYAGATQVPAEFISRNSSCGVLVIHTRRFRP
ncbi:MAG: carboxypeptidase-like regulatory domain-containing protein [Gemmatimonadaceae bacterium]